MKAINWDDELTDERRDELIDKLAGKVVKYGMSIPAVLFLEMHKPFAFLASQTAILASGFLAPFVGIQNVQEYSKLMETRDNVERLIRRIENLTQATSANGGSAKPADRAQNTPA